MQRGQAVEAHTFDLNTWEAEHIYLLEFEANLIYKVSSRIARDIQRNHVLKNNNKKKKTKTNKTC